MVAALGTIFALCGAIAICLIAFNAFPPRKLESKPPVEAATIPVTKVSPDSAANEVDAVSTPAPETTQARPGTSTDDHAIIDQMTAPALNPASSPAPMASPATTTNNELLKGDRPEAGRVNPDRHLSEATRKNLEKERRQAERKRSRLEEMYQKHAISSEAYKRGEEKYRHQIEKYRRAISGTEPQN